MQLYLIWYQEMLWDCINSKLCPAIGHKLHKILKIELVYLSFPTSALWETIWCTTEEKPISPEQCFKCQFCELSSVQLKSRFHIKNTKTRLYFNIYFMAYLCTPDFSNVKCVPWLKKAGIYCSNLIWLLLMLLQHWRNSTHTVYIKIMKLYAKFRKTEYRHIFADLERHILKWLVLHSGTQT